MLRRVCLGLGCRPILFLRRRSPFISGGHAMMELTPVGGADQNITKVIEYPDYELFDEIHYAAQVQTIF